MIPTSFVCMSCDGSGKRRGNLTKNARRMLRAAKIWGKPKPNVESMRLVVKCKSCDGSGLISDITGTSLSKEACGAARDRDDFVVGVAGGGIGGLAVALALQQRGIRVIVYERDVSFNERSQGYGLTMQQGGAALEALGIRFEEESISSSAHYSFKPSGEVIGCYGRRLRAAAQRGSSNESVDDVSEKETITMSKNTSKQNMYHLLRDPLLKVSIAKKTDENRGLKRFRSAEKSTNTSEKRGNTCNTSSNNNNSNNNNSIPIETEQKKSKKKKNITFDSQPQKTKTEKCKSRNKNTKTEKCKSRNKNRHIPRQRLRQLLYERLLPGTVQWGCRVVEYNDNRMNKVELSLYKKQKHKSVDNEKSTQQIRNSLGTKFGTDSNRPTKETMFQQTVSVLVGADGIFSTVRKVKLGDDKQNLRYLNVMVILGIVGFYYEF